MRGLSMDMTLWMETGGIKEDCRAGAKSTYMKCEPDIKNRDTE